MSADDPKQTSLRLCAILMKANLKSFAPRTSVTGHSGAMESEHLETVFADLRPNIVEVS
jgi:hypothetical protein